MRFRCSTSQHRPLECMSDSRFVTRHSRSTLPTSTRSASSQTESLDFRGVDSSRFFMLRGGIPRSIGNLSEVQTRRFVVCRFLVCRLIVRSSGIPSKRGRDEVLAGKRLWFRAAALSKQASPSPKARSERKCLSDLKVTLKRLQVTFRRLQSDFSVVSGLDPPFRIPLGGDGENRAEGGNELTRPKRSKTGALLCQALAEQANNWQGDVMGSSADFGTMKQTMSQCKLVRKTNQNKAAYHPESPKRLRKQDTAKLVLPEIGRSPPGAVRSSP